MPLFEPKLKTKEKANTTSSTHLHLGENVDSLFAWWIGVDEEQEFGSEFTAELSVP